MAKPAAQDRLIGAVERTRREELRVSVRTCKGAKWLDLRVYYEAPDGSMQPSARGVTLSEQDWKQLRVILQQLKGGQPAASPAD
jgi:Transcriptional Coactivator p15 (PC4)